MPVVHSLLAALRSGARPPARVVSRAAAGAALLLLAACGDGAQHSAVDSDAMLPPLTSRGVRAHVVIVDSSARAVTVGVDLQTHQVALGAYQGVVSYDTAAMALVSADATGDGRFANAAGAGVVRFAGFSTSGFAAPRAVQLRFAVEDWKAVRRLQVELSTAGTVMGERLAGDAMQSSRAVRKALEVAR